MDSLSNVKNKQPTKTSIFILSKIGFKSKWNVNWIHDCLGTVIIQRLVNGLRRQRFSSWEAGIHYSNPASLLTEKKLAWRA